MSINHDKDNCRVWIEKDGHVAYVEYELKGNVFDIIHTVVPKPIEGQGVASQLVRYAYDYALHHGYTPAATCVYAQAWMKRNM